MADLALLAKHQISYTYILSIIRRDTTARDFVIGRYKNLMFKAVSINKVSLHLISKYKFRIWLKHTSILQVNYCNFFTHFAPKNIMKSGKVGMIPKKWKNFQDSCQQKKEEPLNQNPQESDRKALSLVWNQDWSCSNSVWDQNFSHFFICFGKSSSLKYVLWILD